MADRLRVSARERLLDAGCALVIEAGLDLLRRGLTSKTIAARAGLSERTFYSEFETKDDYVRALVGHICDAPDSSVNRESFSRRIRTKLVTAGSQDPLVQMRALCDENFERLRNDDRLAARVALAALAHHDEEVVVELRKHYEVLGLTRSDGQVGCGDHAAWGVAVG